MRGFGFAAALLALLAAFGCAAKRPMAAAAPAGPPVAASARALTPPTPLSPPDGAAFTGYPRTVTFTWYGVPEAAAYGIEIDCYGCCQAGVWAIGQDSSQCVKTRWNEFTFAKQSVSRGKPARLDPQPIRAIGKLGGIFDHQQQYSPG